LCQPPKLLKTVNIAKEWQNRPLERKYAIGFMDAVHYNVRQDNTIIKKAVYIAIGIRLDGTKEVIGMWVGGNESAKYWLGILNEIKNRGTEDILIISVDGLTGFSDAIHAVCPNTEISEYSICLLLFFFLSVYQPQ
jgi:putative transposase